MPVVFAPNRGPRAYFRDMGRNVAYYTIYRRINSQVKLGVPATQRGQAGAGRSGDVVDAG